MGKIGLDFNLISILGIFPGLFLLFFQGPHVFKAAENQQEAVYFVNKLDTPILIDGDWDKPVWDKADVLYILNSMGQEPHFIPLTKAKLLYDEENIYGIFQVKDKYVQCVVEETNGPVYSDSCVEFFFSPDQNNPLFYFNLEINCGGVALMQQTSEPHKKYRYLSTSDIEQIEIAHSLPRKVFPEIEEEIFWTIEFRIPLAILHNYSEISHPEKEVVWKANFYKTASKTSNPHYLTWSFVDNPKPDFHLPQYFGSLVFQ
jgi:hypothetical protein